MVNEIFYSIQGESTWAGLPCAFVRLTGCNLRCNYCDTTYAFHQGTRHTINELLRTIDDAAGDCKLVEITGGEPLLQGDVHQLMTRLVDAGKTVLLETSGACDISTCDSRVIRIMDIKTPGSGEEQKNLWQNISHLTRRDEVKFVICDQRDYRWARNIIAKYDLDKKVKAILLSPATPGSPGSPGSPGLSPADLARWILADHLPVRMQLPLHKTIWGPATPGV